MITSQDFEKFTVYSEDDAYQFCYITIKEESFYEDFAHYILDFNMIKKHATINLGITEELSLRDYNEILNRLTAFVDFEKIYDVAQLDDSIIQILDKEYMSDGADLRKDKWGRIGEYIFNILLDSYFNLDCIVRKCALNTSLFCYESRPPASFVVSSFYVSLKGQLRLTTLSSVLIESK